MYKLLFSLLCVLGLGAPLLAQDVEGEVDKIFNRYAKDSGFSGVLIVIRDHSILLEKAYGNADDASGKQNTVKTMFNVASVGKQFTALTILKLEEMRLLKTSDLISKYTGSLGGMKDSATIDHLLLHSSGLFVEGTELDYSTRDKFIASIKSSPLESKPGVRHRYSNAGYTLLAAIAEIVTKKKFEDLLYEMIFKPAGMTSTGYPWESRIDKSLLATGYDVKGKALPAEKDVWGNRGPGNLVTTTGDIFKWYEAAWSEEGSLMSPELQQRMMEDYIPGKETFSWNKTTTSRGKLLLHKGGGRPDFESQVMWWPDEVLYIFFSTNRDKNLRRYLFRDLSVLIDSK